jgi:hypothetical protein
MNLKKSFPTQNALDNLDNGVERASIIPINNVITLDAFADGEYSKSINSINQSECYKIVLIG